jgi:acyl-CoA synthetase (AMP-forming)/AMP-acid ligase II
MSSVNYAGFVDVQMKRRGHQDAIITPDGSWTFARLYHDVNALADHLRTVGVGPGDRVAILAMNSPEYVCSLLAIYRLGAVAVPLNYRLQVEELRYLLADSGSVGVLADMEFVPVVREAVEGLKDLRTRIVLDVTTDPEPGWEFFKDIIREHQGKGVPLYEASFDTLQRIMYTSGTTSHPKGVMITHGMTLCNIVVATEALKLTADDRVLVSSPLYHIAAQDAPGLVALFHGAAIVIMRKFEAQLALTLMSEHRVTGGIFVQAMLHALRDADAGRDHSSVRWMMFGAASGELYRDIRRKFPTTQLVQSYGMTEACSIISTIPEAFAVEKYGSVGTAAPFMEMQVVGPDDGPLAPGEAGEIVIRGPKVTPGYWGDPQRSQEAWRNGWFHTGDVGVMDEDGFLSITDRLKDMIRSGGENVASSEIERVIYEHEAVHEVAVVGVPDERWQEVPKAFVVLKRGAELTPEDLIAHCRAHLASFKTPKHVEFLQALPRNPSGKVLKRELRKFSSPIALTKADGA